MNFVTYRSTYHSSCYRIESRTSENLDELRTCIEKAYVVVGPCGFRSFDFYSKLKIENQKFPIVIFNVSFLNN